jgi:hypothetical protein
MTANVVSWINARKGLRSAEKSFRLLEFLSQHSVQTVFIQETAMTSNVDSVSLAGWKRIAQFGALTAFSALAVNEVKVRFSSNYFLALEFGGLLLGNVHLSAYRWQDRVEQIRMIQEILGSNRLKRFIVGGDFNFAPLPQDGLYGGQPSRWTHRIEREMYQETLRNLGATEYPTSTNGAYTYERDHRSNRLQFRCDFAFGNVPTQYISAKYDHGTRLGPASFTDHSMVIIKLETLSCC